MITIDQAINDLYSAKLSDQECEEVECDRLRFIKQVEDGFKINVFDLNYSQSGINVLTRIPKFFRFFPKLKYLHFYSNLFRDSGLSKILEILQENHQITHLDIGCNDLSDGSLICMMDIIKSTNIKSLQLGRREESLQMNRYTKDSLNKIMNVISDQNSLQCFGISGIPLVKQKVVFNAGQFSKHLSNLISHCTKLKTLDISYCGLNDNDQINLAEGFLSNKSIRNLNISHNSFPYRTRIIDGICHLDKMIRLDLSSCELSKSACDIISHRFSIGWGIIDLNLSENPIGTIGISKLFESLSKNDTLVSLNLSDTSLDKGIAKSFHFYLKRTTVLRDLDLSKNNFGDSVSYVFSEVLPTQDTIVNLNLSSCKITDEGSTVLCKAISQNKTIKKLLLKDNFLSRKNGFDLVEILKSNEVLRMVDLTSNQIDCFALDAIETMCQRNKKSAHDRSLHHLKKQYISLSIQSSKIPVLKKQLGNLTDTFRDLNNEIDDLNSQIESYTVTTAANLELTGKNINDYEMLIDQEKKQIDDIQETMKKMENENIKFLNDFQIKNKAEQEMFSNLESQAQKVEQETVSYTDNFNETREKMLKDISLVEKMIKEINDMRNDPSILKHYEIPDYPFDDEYNTMKNNNNNLISQKELKENDLDVMTINEIQKEESPKKKATKQKKGKSKAVVKKPSSKKKIKK
ncbi:Leucine-rich repeat-containing protein 74A [Tritrichomonas musculus]|uniref:Leucine-rich repeat-containing protein 74A n=1 Tax=Tritrichomonas musculus TaxID=1915356 RepID=A0ABR2GXJ5_9EUKA